MDHLGSAIVLLLLLSAGLLSTCAVNLLPSDITVEQGNYAVFNCSYGCQIMQTHTLSWVVGDLPGIRRTFLRGRTTDFIEKSGLYVEVSDQSTCERDGLDHGKAVEQLRINASSAMLYNRTAVQCVAFPTIDGDQTFFSSYGLLVINVPALDEELSLPSPAVSNTSQQACPRVMLHTATSLASISPTPVCPTLTVVTVTKEVQVTLTVAPTSLPGEFNIRDQPNNCDITRQNSSLSHTAMCPLALASMILLTLLHDIV